MSVFEDRPGLSHFVDRHGKTRWRYRHKGRTVALPAPDDPAFEEAYAAAVANRPRKVAAVVTMPGAAMPETFKAAYRELKRTAKWIAFDEKTRSKNTHLIELFLDSRIVEDHPLVWGDVQVRHMRRAHLEEMLGRYAATPHKAKHLLSAIRKLLKIAAREEWIETDPSALVEWRPAYTGWKPWPVTAMKQFEKRWEPGTAARTCYGLALWLGNRRGDVARLRWDQITTRTVMFDGVERSVEGFSIVQSKNAIRTGGKALFLPITPMLAEILTPIERKGDTVLVTAYGKPFSEKSLTGQMAHWTKLAGLPSGLTMHGLRKSLGVYLAESEASTRQLMDILGHDDMEHAELYSREASQVRLAVQGMDRVTRLVSKKASG